MKRKARRNPSRKKKIDWHVIAIYHKGGMGYYNAKKGGGFTIGPKEHAQMFQDAGSAQARAREVDRDYSGVTATAMRVWW